MTAPRYGLEEGPPPGFFDDDDEPLVPVDSSPPAKPMGPESPRKRYSLTDTGNGELFAEQHRDKARYCPPMGAWFIYDGKRWARDTSFRAKALAVETVRSWPDYLDRIAGDQEDIAKLVFKHVHRSESAHAIEATLRMAQAVRGICVEASEFNPDPWLFNCANGTLDLRTGKVRPHNPADLITKLSPVKYDPEARDETWSMFRKQITGGDKELEQFLCRAAGYFLTGVNTEKCFFLTYSRAPSTGKSTYLDALACAMGDYAMVAKPTTWMKQPNASASQNRGDLTRLLGARLVTSTEPDRNARFDDGLIKTFTGGDPITEMDKHEKAITFTPQCKILFATNHSPRFAASDEAMTSRIRRIEFVHQIPHKDPKVRETLMKPDVAGPAILRWMLAGCLDWQKNGLPIPPSIAASNLEWQRDNDTLRAFFDECLEFTGDENDSRYRLTRKHLKAIYDRWCNEEGVALSYRHVTSTIVQRLREAPYECGDKTIRGFVHLSKVREKVPDRYMQDSNYDSN